MDNITILLTAIIFLTIGYYFGKQQRPHIELPSISFNKKFKIFKKKTPITHNEETIKELDEDNNVGNIQLT